MWGKIRNLNKFLTVTVALLLLFGLALPVLGQDEEPPEEDVSQEESSQEEPLPEPKPHIFITGNDITSPPNAVLHVYGRDLEGNAIDFNRDPLVLTSGGRTIETVVSGSNPVGTLTVFLVDLPNSVEEQLPAIQQAIEQYAAPGGVMQENVDSIAIFQVGESEPKMLLAPTTFHQEVQNFFIDGLTPEEGSTALRDSLGLLLEEVERLKPSPQMASSVVVLSDGTDVVSTEYETEDVIASALEKNIAVNSIWVPGTGLTIAQQDEGQAYLEETAGGTQGFAASLDDGESLNDLWNRIASFRDHARVIFQLDSLGGGGTFNVDLSLVSNPEVSASTTVEVPENQPQVFLNLPEDADALTLPSLEEPILLRLGATVSWLDGFEREISEATLQVNGRDVVNVPVDQLNDFSVEVSNLQYGPNELVLLVVDEQGLRASNTPAIISVVEGERVDIPDTMQPGRNIGSIVFNVFLVLVVLAALVGIFFALRRSGVFSQLTPKGRSRRSGQSVTYSAIDDPEAMGGMAPGVEVSGPPFDAHLEIIESVTDMPPTVGLEGAMIRIGRSPSMCDIAFRDDLTVSRQHAVFMLEGNHFRLFDENSTSGSWVNGRQVPEYGVELADGDEIHLGAVHMMYRQM